MPKQSEDAQAKWGRPHFAQLWHPELSEVLDIGTTKLGATAATIDTDATKGH